MLRLAILAHILILSACNASPLKPDPGKALIIGTYLNGEIYEHYSAGKIIGVISVVDGKSYSYPSLPEKLQVVPGKYVIQHICYLKTDGRPNEVVKQRLDQEKSEEVSLVAGDILFVSPEKIYVPYYLPNGEVIPMPACARTLMKTNPNNPKQDKYL